LKTRTGIPVGTPFRSPDTLSPNHWSSFAVTSGLSPCRLAGVQFSATWNRAVIKIEIMGCHLELIEKFVKMRLIAHSVLW